MLFSGNPEGSKVGLRLVSSIQISWKLRVSSIQNYYPTVWAFPPMDSPDAPTPRPAPRPSWPWREIINQFIQCFVHQQLVHHTAGNRQQQTVVIYSDIWDGKKCGGKKTENQAKDESLGFLLVQPLVTHYWTCMLESLYEGILVFVEGGVGWTPCEWFLLTFLKNHAHTFRV